MNYKKDIERLKRELREAKELTIKLEKQLNETKSRQNNLESNCKHQWGETKYDPEEYQEAVYSHLEGHGSDPEPIYNYYPAKKDRWSRVCKICGKKEYTYEKAPTKYEPKF
ncbi:MAG: hypothetical protein PHT02_01105 [Tissierellia bacterium]|nr:hypothetical protein [Tissierellia bacterium]